MNDMGKIAPSGTSAKGNDGLTNGCPAGRLNGSPDARMSKLARPRKRHDTRVAKMLLVVCAATIVVASALALGSAGTGKDEIPGGSESRAPPPPHNVVGFTYDAGGVVVGGATVTVTNLRTGNSTSLLSNGAGVYEFDLNTLPGGWIAGDLINVSAEFGGMIGYNESAVSDPPPPFLWMDIHMVYVIPEFPMAIVPVAGMFVLFAAIVAVRRRNEAH